MASIIFICAANMCRSVMAEGILKKRLLELGRKEIQVSSMGIHAIDGQSATEHTTTVCDENQIDVSGHKSRPLIPEDLVNSNYIFVMEPVQKEFIHLFFPRVDDRTFLLGAWPGKESRKATIQDPVGRKISDFRKTFQLINSHIERIVPHIIH